MVKILVLIFSVFSAFASVFVTINSIVHKKSLQSLYFILLSLSISIYTAGYAVEVVSNGFETALIALRLQHFGTPFIATLFFLFVASFCKYEVKSKSVKGLIILIPFITFISSEFFDFTNIFYKSISYLKTEFRSGIKFEFGWFYYIFIAYTSIIYIATIFLLIKQIKKSSEIQKRQAVCIAITVTLPFIGSVLNALKLSFYGVNLIPIALSISSLIFVYMIYNLGIYTLVPLGKENVMESMRDALIIVDEEGRLSECNQSAKQIFKVLENTDYGEDLYALAGFPFNEIMGDGTDSRFSLEAEGETKFYRSSISDIFYHGKKIGKSIMIYDVTEVTKLMDSLQKLATTDALTGVYNRRQFFLLATKAIASAKRTNVPLCLLILDLDYFKNVNDKGGHLFGDYVLKEFVNVCNKRVRIADIFARYGGEEFCILTINTDIVGARTLAEDIREAVEENVFSYNGVEMKLTVSIGIAEFDFKYYEQIEEIISDADAALYEAKMTGRNKVCLYK